jgi:hypothetical protein
MAEAAPEADMAEAAPEAEAHMAEVKAAPGMAEAAPAPDAVPAPAPPPASPDVEAPPAAAEDAARALPPDVALIPAAPGANGGDDMADAVAAIEGAAPSSAGRGGAIDEGMPGALEPHARGTSDAARMRLTEEDRAQLEQALRRTMAVMVHASACNNPACPIPNCPKVTMLFRHAAPCPTKITGGCNYCIRMEELAQVHAKTCTAADCLVPRCRELRKEASTPPSPPAGSLALEAPVGSDAAAAGAELAHQQQAGEAGVGGEVVGAKTASEEPGSKDGAEDGAGPSGMRSLVDSWITK